MTETACEIAARQAEDDGLWFVAATAPEAYLQQELRRLTAAVESESPSPLEAAAAAYCEACIAHDQAFVYASRVSFAALNAAEARCKRTRAAMLAAYRERKP